MSSLFAAASRSTTRPLLRPCLASDAAEVVEFYLDIRRDTVPIVHTHEETEAWLIGFCIARGSSWVWESEGGLCAWVDLHGDWVDQLYCRRGSTGQGIGKELIDWAKSQSSGRLQLYTFQVNEGARRFYRREGFQEVEFGDGSSNEEGQPDVKLLWEGNH